MLWGNLGMEWNEVRIGTLVDRELVVQALRVREEERVVPPTGLDSGPLEPLAPPADRIDRTDAPDDPVDHPGAGQAG